MSTQSEEAYQIQELSSGTFKFPEPAANNKLTHIKGVNKWLLQIRRVFQKYNDFYMFLYATVAYIDNSVELRPKSTRIKTELYPTQIEVLSDSEDEIRITKNRTSSSMVDKVRLPAGLEQELQDAGPITDERGLGQFLKHSEFTTELLTNRPLLEAIAPFLKRASKPLTAEDSLTKFKSLRYEWRLNAPGDNLHNRTMGFTASSDPMCGSISFNHSLTRHLLIFLSGALFLTT
jgi:hypothetical protein